MDRITAEDEVEDVLKRIGVGAGERLRESERRRSNLEKFSQLRSRNPNTTLTLEETSTAFVEVEEDEVEEFRKITVTSKKFDQTKTNLPDDYHDYLVQKSMAAHEVGHILYSSWPAIEYYMDQIESDFSEGDAQQYKHLFQSFFNVLEDGAIERFLSNHFRVGEELHHLCATIHEDNYMGKQYSNGDQVVYYYPMFFAIMTATLNIGVYDNGETDKLLDEDNDNFRFAPAGGDVDRERFVDKIIPRLKRDIPKIQSEEDAEERTALIYDLWKFIIKYVDRSQTGSKDEWQQKISQQGSDSYAEGVPENISGSHGEQQQSPSLSDGEGEKGRGEELQEVEVGGSEIERKGKEGVISEAKQESGDWSDEIENIIDTLQAGDGVEEIAIAEDNPVDKTREEKAQRMGKRVEKMFRNRLQREKRDTTLFNQKRGSLDNRRLLSGERGSTRIFKQTKEGGDKDYSCIIVTDRSGSMSGSISQVELAVGSVAWGLQNNGVDTSILDTHNSMTTLAKPFGTDVKDFRRKLFGNRVGGGTPITGTMKFMRERMDRGDGKYPFAIIITDGGASKRQAFKEQVKKANFPVIGLYVGRSRASDQLELYDRAVEVGPEDDVVQKLINMISTVMF